MGAHKLEDLDFSFENETEEEEFEIPLDIEDIIAICRQYSQLGWSLQSQIEAILEHGVEEAITSGHAKKEALPHLKDFLQQIVSGICVGGAVSQATNCIDLIDQYQRKHKQVSRLN